MKSGCFSLLIALFIPFIVPARALYVQQFTCPVHMASGGDFITIPQGLAIPLAIHAVADSSLKIGGQKFFRVTEDVVIDSVLLFGAGAIACGRIQAIERDTDGRCIFLEIEMGSVQASDGSRVILVPRVVKIKTPAMKVGSKRIKIDAEVEGVVLGEALLRV